MNVLSLVQHGLCYGAILSVLLSLAITGSLYWNAEMWLSDYPPDVQEKHGPMRAKTKKQKGIVGVCFLAALLGTVGCSLLRLNRLISGAPIFWPAFLTTFVMLQTFNTVDLLILDWLIFVAWQPRFIILPGTEGMDGYKDYGFHFRGFVKGTGLALIFGLVVAGLSLLLPPVPREGVDFLRDHQQVIELDAERPDFALLDPTTREARVILLGEAHGVATNEELDFALFTYLYETAGVRTYIAETGYSMGHFINQYVQSGDEALLRRFYAALEGTTAWNQARFTFWQRVHAWNQTLPETERVRVIGLDVEHQYPVGVVHAVALLPEDAPPASLAEPVATLRAMVEKSEWNSQVCSSAVDALLAKMDAYPNAASAYLGASMDEFRFTLRSIQYGFEYRATSDANAADLIRDRRIHETYLALGLAQETVYGKWGGEHVQQAPYRGIERIAMLLDAGDSPAAGRVLSIDIVYADSTQLRIRDGEYSAGRLASPRRIVNPLSQAAAGDIALFQLGRLDDSNGSASPFEKELYLLEHPTAGGVTTDYVQFVILMQGAEAARPLGAGRRGGIVPFLPVAVCAGRPR